MCPVDSKTISQTGSNTIWLVPRLGRCTYVEGKPQERGILMTLTRVFPPVQADLHNLLGNGSFSGDHGSPEAGNLSPTRIEIKDFSSSGIEITTPATYWHSPSYTIPPASGTPRVRLVAHIAIISLLSCIIAMYNTNTPDQGAALVQNSLPVRGST